MMIGKIKRLASVTLRLLRGSSSGQKPSPPAPSQFEAFQNHMLNIENGQSMREAAQLLAALETAHHHLADSLAELEREIHHLSAHNALALELVRRAAHLDLETARQLAENHEIEARALREIESGKVYGISKIAKEVIETADSLRSAINAQELSEQSSESASELASLRALHGQLIELLRRYQIEQFVPLNEVFDPNEQESIGQVQANGPSQRNLVAEVKRTGFRIGQRLLRSAYVVIYI